MGKEEVIVQGFGVSFRDDENISKSINDVGYILWLMSDSEYTKNHWTAHYFIFFKDVGHFFLKSVLNLLQYCSWPAWMGPCSSGRGWESGRRVPRAERAPQGIQDGVLSSSARMDSSAVVWRSQSLALHPRQRTRQTQGLRHREEPVTRAAETGGQSSGSGTLISAHKWLCSGCILAAGAVKEPSWAEKCHFPGLFFQET